ncbi:MAG TPA: formimidoylglutamate deiminase [Acidimicrobiaceae bacterium]|nr:formimidoylglutamate deiminase [Acidimicrobiaceae bacterium]
MNQFWCEYAWLGGDTATPGVLLGVDGDRIVSVDIDQPCPSSAVRLDGLTVPGLVNAHSHAFHRALRGHTQLGVGSFWTWREQMYAAAERLDPDSYHRLARAVFGEMVLAGITTVAEFHYLHHAPGGVRYSDANAMGEAIVAAASDAGIRLTLLDTCYLQGGIDRRGNIVPLTPLQERFSDGDVDAWVRRADALSSFSGATTRIGAAVHSVRAVGPADIVVVAEWAGAQSAPLHAHVSEQPAENEQCIAAHHLTPTGVLAEQGALGERFTAVHATHLSGVDVGLLGDAGCTCCLCPTTERDLADGIGAARALRDAGARLAVGSDSHAVIDLFEEARAIELDERLASLIRGHHDAPSLLSAATLGGARSAGWSDAGVLSVGALADFTTISFGSVRMAGVDAGSALEMAVFAASAADVRHVVVGGTQVVRDHAHVSIDVVAELAAAIAELRQPRVDR